MAKQPGLTLSALQTSLARGTIAPVYLVVGTEHFLSAEAVRLITDAVLPQGTARARHLYHGDETDLATVLGDLKTPDLFSPTRLVVVSPADHFVQKHGSALASYVQHPASGATLVLVLDKLDARVKVAKAVDNAGGLVTCTRLYEREVPAWVLARVKAMNREIEHDAAALLADFLGTDLALLASELEKLVIYLGDRRKITAQDVEAVSLRDRGRQIFELTDAVGRRQPARMLAVLSGLLAQGERPAGILFMVARHMRRLWAAKELIANGSQPFAAAHALGVRYFIDQFLEQVNTFTARELRANCSALLRCEATLKSASSDDRVLLETTFLRLTHRPAKVGSR